MIVAELAMTAAQMHSGLAKRDMVPPGTGMLFLHPDGGLHVYTMREMRVPLDIVWIDGAGQILEITANVQPGVDVLGSGAYVLEIAAGEAARLGMRVGQALNFGNVEMAA